MPCHSTSEKFDNYLYNVTNVQQKYMRFLPKASVAINQDRLSLRQNVIFLTSFLHSLQPYTLILD